MENASKALLIAGGVLIAIIILSMGVYLYVLFSNQTNSYNQTISAQEIEKFNSKFTSFVGRENITAQEVVSIINIKNEFAYGVSVIVKKKTGTKITITNSEEFLKEYFDTTFKCTNISYGDQGEVTNIIFTAI